MSAPLRKIVYSTEPSRRTRRGLLSTVTLECGHMETANAKDRRLGRIYCFDCFYGKRVPHMGACILAESAASLPASSSLEAKPSRKPQEPRPPRVAAIPAACPTGRTYSGLTQAYDYFNRELFGGELPSCLVTLQRKAKTFGYFAAERFGTRDKSETTDEIALNPSHFASRSTREVLSTLVHEMAHLKRQRIGKPPRGGYHDKPWAAVMREVGLIPSNTGQPGGKETGQKVSHYIEQGGRFDRACARLEAEGFDLAYVELWDDQKAERAKKAAASKTKYTCPSCDANAWAKPEAKLICGDCDERMEG